MDLTSIFCAIDDYCRQQKINWNGKILLSGGSKKEPKISAKSPSQNHSILSESPTDRCNCSYVLGQNLSLSEIATIVVYFHLSHYKEFKNFYLIEIKKNLKSEFPKAVSYNRFVELMSNALSVIASFLSNSCLEKCSGISFIDSTILWSMRQQENPFS